MYNRIFLVHEQFTPQTGMLKSQGTFEPSRITTSLGRLFWMHELLHSVHLSPREAREAQDGLGILSPNMHFLLVQGRLKQGFIDS